MQYINRSGTSERYLGRALRDFARRNEVIATTKFLSRTPEEIAVGVRPAGVCRRTVTLAWLLTKVTAPVVGAAKIEHIEAAARAVDLRLTDKESRYPEAPCLSYSLAGVMVQNKPK